MGTVAIIKHHVESHMPLLVRLCSEGQVATPLNEMDSCLLAPRDSQGNEYACFYVLLQTIGQMVIIGPMDPKTNERTNERTNDDCELFTKRPHKASALCNFCEADKIMWLAPFQVWQ